MNTLLIVCGAIATIAGAIGAVIKYIVKPLNELNQKMAKIDELEEGQRVMARALLQTLQHLAYGDHIEDLKKAYETLTNYLISH